MESDAGIQDSITLLETVCLFARFCSMMPSNSLPERPGSAFKAISLQDPMTRLKQIFAKFNSAFGNDLLVKHGIALKTVA